MSEEAPSLDSELAESLLKEADELLARLNSSSFSYSDAGAIGGWFSFLSPPVHHAWWAHMHRFLSVCPSRGWYKGSAARAMADPSRPRCSRFWSRISLCQGKFHMHVPLWRANFTQSFMWSVSSRERAGVPHISHLADPCINFWISPWPSVTKWLDRNSLGNNSIISWKVMHLRSWNLVRG